MKKLMIVVVCSLFVAPVFATDSSDGCGIGWQVTNKKSLIATTTRGTTNMFVPPSFGMTSGTIGCDQHTFAQNEKEAVDYVATNYEVLKMEMAEGNGEFLEGFGRMMGCSDSALSGFGQMTQENYGSLVHDGSAMELYKRVKGHIATDASLSAQCGA